ncbi:hypothetical protein [Sphingomonas sp. 28-63-12]|uniref:hypothetical protein n=1 Tax=Sphingomonas sp. 28-63-12 TaxID=1970434 RepID=UPI000BC84887|nr:MAG: hypothetical protein B7Y47_08585 [Sphingomonas sp. 28-63-12]
MIGRLASLVLALLIAATVSPLPALAQEKSAVKPGFAIPPDSAARIIVFRPSIVVGEQSTGGLFEPNADWTEQARLLIGAALRSAQTSIGNHLTDYGDPIGEDAVRVAAYQALFTTVAEAVIEFQFFPGNRLPTKKRDKGFDWTLGPEIRQLARAAEADYALFINTEDQFGSGGRKAAQVVGALVGIGIRSGVHKGYAGLVDLRTGDLVWLNADVQMGGDVRTPDGAAKRVAQLLEDFPSQPAPIAAAAKAP